MEIHKVIPHVTTYYAGDVYSFYVSDRVYMFLRTGMRVVIRDEDEMEPYGWKKITSK